MKKSNFGATSVAVVFSVAALFTTVSNKCFAGVQTAYIAIDFIDRDGALGNNELFTDEIKVNGVQLVPPQSRKDVPNFRQLIQFTFEDTVLSTIDFFFHSTEEFANLGLPDSISIYLLNDDALKTPMFSSRDSNGNNKGGALFQLDINGTRNGNFTLFENPLTGSEDASWSFGVTPSIGEPKTFFNGHVDLPAVTNNNTVPEPASFSMWAFGALALGYGIRRRQKVS